MSKVLTDSANYQAIASAIRAKGGASGALKPGQMAEAILNISGGGGSAVIESKSITANGTYTAPTGVDGYNPVTVDVPNSYVAADEGKVVQSGALVAQTSLNVTTNGTYDTTTNNSVVVNVSGGNMMSGTTPPTADMGSDGDYYKQIFPLPSDVDFVEYLQSSGTQYINTGIIGNQDTGYLYDQEVTIAAWGFGARSGAQSRAIVITSDGTSTTKNTFDLGAERKTISDIPSRRKMVLKDRKLYINGTLKARYGMPTGFTTPNPLLLFGVYNGGSVALTSGGFKLYRAVIYDGIIPIADYLPCLDGDGVACMWDNVAGEYVYNDGTGDFAYGTTITPTALDPVLYRKVGGAWVVVG